MGANRRIRGALFGLLVVAVAFGVWVWLNALPPPGSNAIPTNGSYEADAAITPASCGQCHQPQYDSWCRTYHRTMTREVTPENVKGDFNNAVHQYQAGAGTPNPFADFGQGAYVTGYAVQFERDEDARLVAVEGSQCGEQLRAPVVGST